VTLAILTTTLLLALPPREYRAVVHECYDGDTCTVDIDLGLDVMVHDVRVRLAEVDAWELRDGLRGRVARTWINEMLKGRVVRLVVRQTRSGRDARGKYGRLLATVWLGDVNINDQLVKLGHGVDYVH